MGDLWAALSYTATNERIIGAAGNVLAERERRRGLRALILSKTIVDATGRPLLEVLPRAGRFVRQVDVLTPQDEPIAHIRGRAFSGRPRTYVIRDGAQSVIGRVEGTWLGWDFRLLDNEGHLRARGVKTGRKEGKEWSVEIECGQPLVSPWPELTAAFFLSRSALEAVNPPP